MNENYKKKLAFKFEKKKKRIIALENIYEFSFLRLLYIKIKCKLITIVASLHLKMEEEPLSVISELGKHHN